MKLQNFRFSCSTKCSYLSLVPLFSLQSSLHWGEGFIQSVGPCDSWWQELKITLILYGTVNLLLCLLRRCQVYLGGILAASPQRQARCIKEKRKNAVKETMSLSLYILQFSLRSFYFLVVVFFLNPFQHFCVSTVAFSWQNHATHSKFDLFVFFFSKLLRLQMCV